MTERDRPLFHGTRDGVEVGREIQPQDRYVYFSPSIDDAVWAAELAEGAGPPRILVVAATGPTEDASDQFARPPHPTMTWRSPAPVSVLAEVEEWVLYHGTKAKLRPGELIEAGHTANFGPSPRKANFVYFTRTLDAAAWGAELALGDGTERVFVVEATGPFEDDPNLTNMKFRGNPTKSFRSREPLRVVRELKGWPRHPREAVHAMKAGLAKLAHQGVEPDD